MASPLQEATGNITGFVALQPLPSVMAWENSIAKVNRQDGSGGQIRPGGRASLLTLPEDRKET